MSALQRLAAVRGVLRDRYPFGILVAAFAALILVLPDPRHYRDFYYVAILVPFLALLRWPDITPVLRSRTFAFGAAYMAWMWVSLFWSPETTPDEFYHVARRIFSTALFVVLVGWRVQREEGFSRRIFQVMSLACVVTLLLSAYWLPWKPHLAGTRLGAWLWDNVNTAGQIYAVVLVGLVAYALREQQTRAGRLCVGALSALLAAAVVLSGSRAAIIAAIAAIAVPIVLARSLRAVAAFASGTAVAVGAWIAWFGVDHLHRRVDPLRIEVWSRYWDMSLGRPWLGYGLGFDPTIVLSNGRPIGDPHNMLLSGLLLGGIVGALIVLGLFAAAGLTALRAWRDRSEAGPLALFLYLAVHGLFESAPMVENADWKWLYFWLPLALIAGSEAATRARASPRHAAPPAAAGRRDVVHEP